MVYENNDLIPPIVIDLDSANKRECSTECSLQYNFPEESSSFKVCINWSLNWRDGILSLTDSNLSMAHVGITNQFLKENNNYYIILNGDKYYFEKIFITNGGHYAFTISNINDINSRAKMFQDNKYHRTIISSLILLFKTRQDRRTTKIKYTAIIQNINNVRNSHPIISNEVTKLLTNIINQGRAQAERNSCFDSELSGININNLIPDDTLYYYSNFKFTDTNLKFYKNIRENNLRPEHIHNNRTDPSIHTELTNLNHEINYIYFDTSIFINNNSVRMLSSFIPLYYPSWPPRLSRGITLDMWKLTDPEFTNRNLQDYPGFHYNTNFLNLPINKFRATQTIEGIKRSDLNFIFSNLVSLNRYTGLEDPDYNNSGVFNHVFRSKNFAINNLEDLNQDNIFIRCRPTDEEGQLLETGVANTPSTSSVFPLDFASFSEKETGMLVGFAAFIIGIILMLSILYFGDKLISGITNFKNSLSSTTAPAISG